MKRIIFTILGRRVLGNAMMLTVLLMMCMIYGATRGSGFAVYDRNQDSTLVTRIKAALEPFGDEITGCRIVVHVTNDNRITKGAGAIRIVGNLFLLQLPGSPYPCVGAIYVNDRFGSWVTDEQLRATLIHEIGHIVHMDVWRRVTVPSKVMESDADRYAARQLLKYVGKSACLAFPELMEKMAPYTGNGSTTHPDPIERAAYTRVICESGTETLRVEP